MCTKFTKGFGNQLSGPGSLTCDRAGPVTAETCKTCLGTGSCMYGKTAEEIAALLKSSKYRS